MADQSQFILAGALDHLWISLATVLVLFMQAGFLLLEGGSVRSKNTINVAQKNITDLILCCAIFFLFGGFIMFGAGETGFFGFGGFSLTDTEIMAPFLFQLAFCATAATLISGAVSERMTFKGYVVLTIVTTAITYPLFGHLVWGNAILPDNPAFLADIGFKDYAGSTVVHVIGGAAALAAVIKIGPRIGRYDEVGNVVKMRGHSSLLANLGVMILAIGWLGFNAGAAKPVSALLSVIILNTVAAFTFGGLAGLLYDLVKGEGIFHPRMVRNGALGGLVCITAACAFVDIYASMAIGFIGGVSVVYSSELLTHKLKIDDPLDVVAVHLVAGAIGTLAFAGFAETEYLTGTRLDQLLIQAFGLAMAIIWAFSITWIALTVLSKVVALRVSPEAEEVGLNISEHDDAFDLGVLTDLYKQGSGSESVDFGGLGSETLNDSSFDPDKQLNAVSKVVDGAKVDRQKVTEAKNKIYKLKTRDHLTGLFNRAEFKEITLRITTEVNCPYYAVLYMDLDGFKSVNDSFGHGVGDAVLQEISKRINQVAPAGSIVARFGGDEFVLFVPFANAEDEEWRGVCSNLIKRVGETIRLDNLELYVGLSIGVALSPEHDSDVEALLRLSDMALYEAKAMGKGRYTLFERNMQLRAERRKQLEIDMRAGIARDEFHTVYQPQYSTSEKDLIGFEALMRWEHPEYGSISPTEFIPIAEETGLIVELSERLIYQACASAAKWPTVQGRKCQLGVNISPIQFLKLDVCGMLTDVLQKTGLEPELLEIEITESTLIQDMEATCRVLHDIRSLGVRIAIDDFGTGYSSLNYLQQFPIDRLKVDKTFVASIGKNITDSNVVDAIVRMGKSLGLSVIAEGVETPLQHKLLKDIECDQVQGFLFSPPVSLARAVSMIVEANDPAFGAAQTNEQQVG